MSDGIQFMGRTLHRIQTDGDSEWGCIYGVDGELLISSPGATLPGLQDFWIATVVQGGYVLMAQADSLGSLERAVVRELATPLTSHRWAFGEAAT